CLRDATLGLRRRRHGVSPASDQPGVRARAGHIGLDDLQDLRRAHREHDRAQLLRRWHAHVRRRLARNPDRRGTPDMTGNVVVYVRPDDLVVVFYPEAHGASWTETPQEKIQRILKTIVPPDAKRALVMDRDKLPDPYLAPAWRFQGEAIAADMEVARAMGLNA